MGRDDLSTGGAETMNAASTQPRSFDVLCAGLAVGNVVVRPVPEHFSGGDTVQVQEISMMGGGDAFNQACVLAALGEKPALLSRMANDDSGRMMRAALQKRGVDDRFVFSDPATDQHLHRTHQGKCAAQLFDLQRLPAKLRRRRY